MRVLRHRRGDRAATAPAVAWTEAMLTDVFGPDGERLVPPANAVHNYGTVRSMTLSQRQGVIEAAIRSGRAGPKFLSANLDPVGMRAALMLAAATHRIELSRDTGEDDARSDAQLKRAFRRALDAPETLETLLASWKRPTSEARRASRAPAAGRASAGQAAHATVEGVRFTICTSVAELCALVEREGKGALRLATIEYGEQLASIANALSAHYGSSSREYLDSVPSPLVCAGCGFNFPGSYKLGLQGFGRGSTMTFGATPGHQEFGSSGICTLCGSDESLLVYECFRTDDIGEDDVAAIRRHWRAQGALWWQGAERSQAICDSCNADLARGEGCLSGSDLWCESCVESYLADGVAKLRKNPHYFGQALLRTVRNSSGS